ncbi:MAG: hypothetical protein IT294_05825 [Deltaproteobacteria bacterium]|nr:hypothetical protein [Deltaproteobacteria bacterium]
MLAGFVVRRARRNDLARVRALLGAPADAARADRKRFRRLVGTLREDLYVAEREGEAGLAGLVVIAYVRGLGPSTALVRELRGDAAAVAELLACAEARAAARGCARIEVHADAAVPVDPPWEDAARIRRREVTP